MLGQPQVANSTINIPHSENHTEGDGTIASVDNELTRSTSRYDLDGHRNMARRKCRRPLNRLQAKNSRLCSALARIPPTVLLGTRSCSVLIGSRRVGLVTRPP